MALCRHVDPFVVPRRVMRRGWGCSPVDIRYGGCSGVARCAAGYRRFAARSGAVLRHRQRSSTHEERDDCETSYRGHIYPPLFVPHSLAASSYLVIRVGDVTGVTTTAPGSSP